MPEEKNPAEEPEKTPEGDQPAEGGDKKPEEKEVEETGKKPAEDPDKKNKAGDGDEEEMVTISKKKLAKLEGKHNSRGAKNRVSKKAKRSNDRGGSRFSFEEPEVPDPSDEETDLQNRSEFVKLKEGVADLIFDDEEILKAVKADPTLKRILKNNPLALLDDTPIDAEDALEQISDYLDDIVSSKSEDDGDEKDDKKKDKKETTPAPQEPLDKDKTDKKDEKISTAQGMQKVEKGLEKRFEEAGL